MKNHLIIPHKNRLDSLINQVNSFINFKKQESNITINYVEQIKTNDLHNSGITINAGYKILEQFNECDAEDNFWYIPVDIILSKNFSFLVPENTFVSIAPVNPNDGHDHYKIFGIKIKDFKKVDGLSNLFFGWGSEDGEFKMRCLFNKLEMKHIQHHQSIEDNLFSDNLSKEKMGERNASNMGKNVDLGNASSLKEYKGDGLSTLNIELYDRFELIEKSSIFYNKFEVK